MMDRIKPSGREPPPGGNAILKPKNMLIKSPDKLIQTATRKFIAKKILRLLTLSIFSAIK